MTKKYSTKAYYSYAKRMLEGDLVLASSNNLVVSSQSNELALSSAEVKPVDSQFKGLIASAGAGAIGALACIKYLDSSFHIGHVRNIFVAFKRWGSQLPIAADSHNKFIKILADYVSSALAQMGRAFQWLYNFLESKTHSGIFHHPLLSRTIGSSKYTYGTALSIALVGAMIGAIVYKIYKVITKMLNSKKTTESYYKVQLIKMRKAFNESTVTLNSLLTLTEGDFGDSASLSIAEKLIDKSRSTINEMWVWATKTPFHLLATASLGLFIPYINWVIAIVAICKAGIVCWDGLKKDI